MFKKILIANRGEIACRVIRTTKRLGIASVAVYSEADGRARHVELADEAWPIGAAPARESYLAIDRIIDAAVQAGAEAIHPGYGFLSENADFAEACAKRDVVFVGPPPSAIRAMGSKAAAKSLMERSGVPLVPGYHGELQDVPTFSAAAAAIGYPVLVKASAGGGGKGMRIVEDPTQLLPSIESAKREATASFGDDRIIIEKYLTHPRHIEIQIFADMFGNTISLFERDCSVQRRHQKIIEEAPAPGLDSGFRQAIGDAAVNAAKAVGYVGAGTVEFIVEDGEFYFMEMNTRLQVEHPVTEMITGLELVEWQLRIASGETLPLMQEQVMVSGHAIETRIYAEDPARDFMPSIGTLVHLRQPQETDDVRIDTGVRQGDAITQHYDPMIAKLIVRGENRGDALQRLRRVLSEYEVVGVQTNLDLLRAIVSHPTFDEGAVDTGFITRHADVLFSQADPALNVSDDPVVCCAASLAVLADMKTSAAGKAERSGDPWSPWDIADGWQMNSDGYQDLAFIQNERPVSVRLHPQTDGTFSVQLPGGPVVAVANEDAAGMTIRIDGVQRRARVVRRDEGLIVVVLNGRNHPIRYMDPLAPPKQDRGGDGRLTAPIPARVTRILVEPGDPVKRGMPLLVLEAMKMELTVTAPIDGTIGAVRCSVGDMVDEGAELISFAEAEVPSASAKDADA